MHVKNVPSSTLGMFFAFVLLCGFTVANAAEAFIAVNEHPAAKATTARLLKVGLFTDVKSIYLLRANDTIAVTAEGNKIQVVDGKQKKKTTSLNLKPNKKLSASTTKKFPNRYEGSIHVSAKNGKLTVTNEVDVEDYLRGVVPYEIGKLDAERYEALKVQAVAARTYAYKHFGSREVLGFDVYADTRDQVYNGTTGATELTDKAIKETEHEIIAYNGEPIEAYYHSTCAGHTASLAVWGKESLPYLTPRSDLQEDGSAFCKASSYMTWERKFDAKTLAKLIEANQKAANIKNPKQFKKVLNIVVEATYDDGRIMMLSVLTEKGTITARGDKTRWLFSEGGKILPSSAFAAKRKGDEWILTGKGFGHGIGMCQMGARERAKAGQNYKEILEHYYYGAHVEKHTP